MKKLKFYLLSFIIPLILLITVFLFRQVLTGKFSILTSDLFAQYYKLFFDFKGVLDGTSNIFYSFSKGLGGGMISTYAYYLFSPFNFILSLFSYDNIYMATIIIIFLKISLCGLTMFNFLKYHFQDKQEIYLLIFSTAYALSLYNIGNYFQVMWLDAVLLAPLVLLGIDKLILEKKPLLYGVSLFLIVLTNYYMGYMVCLFSIIYFIYRLLLNKPNKKIISMFIITSLLSGMMTMFLNIPNILATLSGDRMTKTYVGLFNMDVLGLFSKIFIGAHDSNNILNTSYAFLYCGIIMIPLLSLYFLNKKILKKEKILSSMVLFIMLISIFISPINYVWHLFSPPNCFNYRYIFLFIIFILYLCCKSFFNLKHLEKKDYYLIGPILPILGLLVYFRNIMPLTYIYISVGLYLVYLILLYNLEKKDVKFLLILLVFAEIYFNIHIIFLNIDLSYTNYIKGSYNSSKESFDFVENYNESLFYRVEADKKDNYNDSFYLNYNSASTWISTLNRNLKFFYQIGYKYGTNMYDHKSYPITDSLFGIKYYETIEQNDNYNVVYTHSISTLPEQFYGLNYVDSYVYQNPYALSLGYMVNSGIKQELVSSNCFEVQDKILNDMTSLNKPVYSKEILEKKQDSFYLTIKEQSDFNIVYNLNSKTDEFEYDVYVNDNFYEHKEKNDANTTYIENEYNIGDTIKVSFQPTIGNVEIISVASFKFNLDNFKTNINYLTNQQLNITDFKDGYVKGNVDVLNDGVLFTSIPYENGWEVYVDGVKTNNYAIYDTFLGIDLSKGVHEIEFVFKTPGLKTGIIISSISAILFIIYQVYQYKRNKNSSN